jgi:16S rRNA (guanine966-N2)-methyltransferase
MKDRTREAVMNLLGGTLEGSIAFDLFGGSGILAFEAISRGSDLAIVWEILKFGAVRIEAFAKELGIEDQVRVVSADVFRWSADWESVFPTLSIPEKCPWLVFCCPPYALWESNGMELKELIQQWITAAPPGSLFAIELEQNTPDAMLPESLEWDLRRYAPAKIAIGQTS